MRDSLALLRGSVYTYRCRLFNTNITIGSGLRIYKKLRINARGKVNIGNDCVVDGIIGDKSLYVCIDSYNPATVIRIGNHARLFAARIGAKHQITIGDDVLIEESGITDTDFHSIEKGRRDPSDENLEKCKVSIGNRVSVGARSMIMKGVTIGDDAIISPGSVVTASVKPGSVVCGNPARPFHGSTP
jgi:acetyltransferase-like isoleucine patch superfamily enzyme